MVNPEQQTPVPAEAPDASIDPIIQQLEVLSRTLDMIPNDSALERYFAEPATELVDDDKGHKIVKEKDHSQLDEVKFSMGRAFEDYQNGEIGTVRLMYGSVNAFYDAHRGTGIPNMRNTFEQLSHFNITGSSSFHNLLNRKGRNAGKLELSMPGKMFQSENNKAKLAKGAVDILDGVGAVMYDGFDDKPTYKLYGMRNPETGELLPNTFMFIMSGTFSDKDGTESNFSNLASANVVLIPDEIIERARQPEAVSEGKFDINKVDWSLLEDGHFRVHRSGGGVDKGGWTIKEVKEIDGVYKATIRSWDSQKGTIEKKIPVERLIEWQQKEPTGNEKLIVR